MEGVGDAASKARLARIKAELAEKREDLDDTRYQHSIDMQQEGYDSLSEKAQKTLDDTLKQVEGNAATQEQVIAMMLKRVEKNYDSAYSAIQAKIKQTGTVVGKTAEKQIADMDGTLAPLQAWATQVQANEGVLSEFSTTYDQVVEHLSTETIRFTTDASNAVLGAFGLWESGLLKFKSTYEEVMGGLESNGQQVTSFDSNTDKKQAEQAAGGETATQAKARRDTLSQMYKYISTKPAKATEEQVNAHKKDKSKEISESNSNDKLWAYLYKLTGRDASAKDMVHLANYLKTLGVEFKNVIPSENASDLDKKLTTAMKDEILAALKQKGFGTNQGAASFISTRKLAEPGVVKQKENDVLWTYLYNVLGRDLSEADMLHIGRAYTNVSGLPTETSGQKLTAAQKKAIVTALQYNGFDLAGYDLSATDSGNIRTVTKATTLTESKATSDITGNINKAKEQDLKQYIAGITGKTPTDAELVKLAREQGISGVTADQKSLNETQAAALLKKLKDTGWNSSKKGYANGTTGIPYTGSHWTHSGELLVRKDGAYLTPLSKGDGVIPANLTENLMKWGAIDPSAFLMKMGKVPTANNTSNTTYNNSYESLLTVYGDVDKEALPELQEILKRACDYTNKYNAREARKLGRK